MAEPENHTLRLLQEIRETLRRQETRFDQIDMRFERVQTELDLLHSDLSFKIESLRGGLCR